MPTSEATVPSTAFHGLILAFFRGGDRGHREGTERQGVRISFRQPTMYQEHFCFFFLSVTIQYKADVQATDSRYMEKNREDIRRNSGDARQLVTG